MSPQMDWTVQGSSAAEFYERYLVPTLFTPWADGLGRARRPQAGRAGAGCGRGTGAVTRLAAQRVWAHRHSHGPGFHAWDAGRGRALPPPSGAHRLARGYRERHAPGRRRL